MAIGWNALSDEICLEILKRTEPRDRLSLMLTCRRIANLMQDRECLQAIPILRPVINYSPQERRNFFLRLHGDSPAHVIPVKVPYGFVPYSAINYMGTAHLLYRDTNHYPNRLVLHNLSTGVQQMTQVSSLCSPVLLGMDPLFVAIPDHGIWNFFNSNLEQSAPPLPNPCLTCTPIQVGSLAGVHFEMGGQSHFYLLIDGTWTRQQVINGFPLPVVTSSQCLVVMNPRSNSCQVYQVTEAELEPTYLWTITTPINPQTRHRSQTLLLHNVPYLAQYAANQIYLTPIQAPNTPNPCPSWQLTLPFSIYRTYGGEEGENVVQSIVKPTLSSIPLGKGPDCILCVSLFIGQAGHNTIETARFWLKENGTHTVMGHDLIQGSDVQLLGTVISPHSWSQYYSHDIDTRYMTRLELLAPPSPSAMLNPSELKRAYLFTALVLSFPLIHSSYRISQQKPQVLSLQFARFLEVLSISFGTILTGSVGLTAITSDPPIRFNPNQHFWGTFYVTSSGVFSILLQQVYKAGWKHLGLLTLATAGATFIGRRLFQRAHPTLPSYSARTPAQRHRES